VKPHADRITPLCPIFHQCGGCQTQHLSYQAQRTLKRQHVIDCLERIGGNKGVVVHPVVGMENPWEYRNKVAVPFGVKEGEMVAGFYATRSHDIIDMDDCGIQHPEMNQVLTAVKKYVRDLRIPVYQEKQHKGILRHVVVRIGVNTGEMMVVFVTNGNQLPHKEELVARLHGEFPGIQSIIQNINSKRTNVILGPANRLLWGREVIYDTIGALRFAISPHSFFQVNAIQTKVLYDQVLRYAELTKQEVVLDAYCGIGTIALYLASEAKKVYGVEIVPEAIADAKQNAALNEIHNAQFKAGEADEIMLRWYNEGVKPDVIVVDPPRKGCEPGVLDAIENMIPKKVIYVSCNPSTLARDAKILAEKGFSLMEVQPIDLFPQTEHVECVALFEERNEEA
jgi:23S rRNA (uracil1939-C5)-methyltransferase